MPEKDWRKKQSLPSALIQISIAGVVLAVGVYLYVQRGVHKREVSERIKEARAAALKDNPADLGKALNILEGVLSSDAKNADALALAADAETELWLTHQVPGAEAKARSYLTASEAAGARSEDRFGNHVLQLVADGKAEEAEQYAEDLRKKGASGGKLWYAMAEAYDLRGSLAMAKQAYLQATDKGWKNPRYYAAFAERLIEQGDDDQALEMAGKGIADNPDHFRSQLVAALAKLLKPDKTGRSKEAEAILKDALAHEGELTPGLKARAGVLKAELAIADKRYDDAVTAAGEALSTQATYSPALWTKARALALKKDATAGAQFAQAAKARPSATAIALDGAQLLQAAGDTAGAVALLDGYANFFQAVQVTSSDGKTAPALERDDRYWLVKGQVLQGSGKEQDALAAYDKAIAIGGLNVANAYYAKGAMLLEKKDYDKAAEVLKAVTPEDGTGHLADAYTAMGTLLFAKGDYPSGCQNYAFALARLKATAAPKDRMNDILEDVNRRLLAAKQKEVAKAWMREAKPIIQ